MRTIRFGIIGTNFISDQFIEGLEKVEGAVVNAAYSRTKERAESFAKKHHIPYTFTEVEEMAKSNLIDAVYIASPNGLHKSQSILFLRHKKHVLCEKAFASNVNEVEEMIKVAKENEVILMEAIKNLYLPNFSIVKNNLSKIGKVRKYFASFCQYSSRYDAYKQGTILNAFKPELSNGALVDIGVYCIAPMVSLFGLPEAINAQGVILESGVDGEGSVVFGYPEMTATIMYSKISSSDLASEIQGEEGTIRIEKINNFNKVILIKKGEVPVELGSIQEDKDLCYETQAFIKLIEEDNRHLAKERLEQSKVVVAIMEEVRKQIGVLYPADEE